MILSYTTYKRLLTTLFGVPPHSHQANILKCSQNEKGGPLNPNYVYNHFSKAIKKANVKKIRFHDLRHTHASLMLLLGEHPKIVSERLGHSSIEMTMNTYSHVTFDMQKESSDRFEKTFQQTN